MADITRSHPRLFTVEWQGPILLDLRCRHELGRRFLTLLRADRAARAGLGPVVLAACMVDPR